MTGFTEHGNESSAFIKGGAREFLDYFSDSDSQEGLCFMELGYIRGCIQKFPDWPPGARIANGTALCYLVQLYRYFVSKSGEFCRHNPLCCISTSVCCCSFRYRLSLETFGYTVLQACSSALNFFKSSLCSTLCVIKEYCS
jgi:hypothetical protein